MPGTLRVLYVDDDHALLEIGKLFLEQSGDISIETIDSATAALNLLKREQFDAIISDYQMPNMDGIEFLKAVRNSDNSIPFILFTGKGREEVVIQALNEGANFYLQKGGDPDAQFAELTHKIRIAFENHQAAEKIQVLNRLYSVLSATNKAIFNIRSRKEFFHEICRILVETGGFRMAWIGLADPEHRIIRPVASAGHVDGYLDTIQISTDDVPQGRGPTGTAFRENKFYFCNDITTDPRMEPWRENALKRGYLANAAFPFALGTKNAGILSLYAPVTGFFNNQIIGLLEELAADISFSLKTIDDQDERKRADEELQKQNAFTDALLNSIPGLFYLYDDEGRLIRWNKNHESVTGYSAEELAGMHLLDWYKGDARDTETITKGVERALSDGYAESVANLTTKIGKKIPFYFTAVKIEIAGRKYFTGIGIDITRRKQVEEALRETSSRLSFALRSAKAGTWDWDFPSGKLAWSPEFLELFCLPPDVTPSFETWLTTLHPDDRAPALQKIEQAVKEHRDLWNEYRVFLPGGGLRWIGASGRTSYSKAGEPVHMSGVCMDITDKRCAEEDLLKKNEELWASYEELNATNEELRHTMDELAASEKIFRTLFQQMLNGFAVHEIICDEDGRPCNYRFIDVNPAFERMTGLHRKDLVGKTVLEVLPGLEPTWIERYARVAITGTPDHFENYSADLNRFYEVSVYQNAPGQFTTVISDVTERKRTEADLRVSEEALSAMLNGITEAAFMMSPEGVVLATNETAAKRLGQKCAVDLIGKNAFSLLSAEVRIHRQKKIQELLESGEPVQFEDIRNGRIIDQTIYPVKNPDGTIGRLAVFGKDITDHKQAEEALRENELLLREVFNNANDSVFLLERTPDGPGKYLLVNDKAPLMLGYSRDELMEMSPRDIVPDDIQKKVMPEVIKKLRKDGQATFESAHRRKDGSIYPVEVSTRTFRYKGKDVDLSITRDITERKMAEVALRKSEERYRLLADNSTDVIWTLGLDGTFTYVSPSIISLRGYTPEEVMNQSLDEMVSVRSRAAVHETMQRVLEEAKSGSIPAPSVMEVEQPCKDGSSVWTEIVSHLLFDASGNATGFIGISRNITERKLAEEALKKSEERYKIISGTTTDFVFSCSRSADDTYSIQWMAGAVEGITGFTIDELRAMGCWRCLVDPEDYSVFDDSVINLPPGTSSACILRIHTKNGTIRWLEVNTTHVPGTLSSLPEQVFGGCRDITGRRRAEEALMEVNRKLNLLSGITRHDISNQLTVLQGYMVMFEKNHPDPSFSVYFQKMKKSVDRISAMIQLTKEYEEIGVNTPVWQEIRTFVEEEGNNCALGDIRLRNDVPAGSEVFADPLITRVFYNLVDNAVRYGGKVTTIRFSVEDRDGDHVIVCEDDGAGIPHEEKEKIFERGFGKNTGLGLFLSREILAITGITITETGGPGKGARFEITVPKGMFR